MKKVLFLILVADDIERDIRSVEDKLNGWL
jgi:hypothetical protein